MVDLVISPDLWTTYTLPEGILERWRATEGTTVQAGNAVAEVRIGEDLHELLAPATGRLSIEIPRNAVVEPGSILGRIS